MSVSTAFSKQASEPPVPEREARAELQRILADPNFRSTDRNRRFLRYVSEKLFEGNADRIKAYAIAVDVFGRPKDFDPALDPIVRIEATRLRASLAHYYETYGAHHPLRIELPKGGYQPAIIRQAPDNTLVCPRSGFSDKPHLRVSLVDSGSCPQAAEFGEVLTNILSQFQTLRLVTAVAGDRHRAPALLRQRIRPPVLELRLTYGALEQNGLVRWQLLDLDAGEILASDRQAGEPATDSGPPLWIARLANRVGGWQGVINNRELRRDLAQPTLGHGCLLRAFHGLRTGEPLVLKEARAGLEASIAERGSDAEARAALALLLLATNTQNRDEQERAAALAGSAAALAPYSALAARAQVAGFLGLNKMAAGLLAAQRAVLLNPHDREHLAAIGRLLCLAGNWSEGIPYLERAQLLDEAVDVASLLTLSAWREGSRDEARRHLEPSA